MRAITDGRLEGSVSRTDRGYWKIDKDAADLEWDQNSDQSQQRDEPAGGRPRAATATPSLFQEEQTKLLERRVTHAEASARKVDIDAQLKKLELDRQTGNLIDRVTVRNEAFLAARVVRDAILRLPDRLAAELAAETVPQKVHAKLVEELARACDTLSEDFMGRAEDHALE